MVDAGRFWEVIDKIEKKFLIGCGVIFALLLFFLVIVIPITTYFEMSRDSDLCKELIDSSAYADGPGLFVSYGVNIEEGYVECCYAALDNHKKITKCDVISRWGID